MFTFKKKILKWNNKKNIRKLIKSTLRTVLYPSHSTDGHPKPLYWPGWRWPTTVNDFLSYNLVVLISFSCLVSFWFTSVSTSDIHWTVPFDSFHLLKFYVMSYLLLCSKLHSSVTSLSGIEVKHLLFYKHWNVTSINFSLFFTFFTILACIVLVGNIEDVL